MRGASGQGSLRSQVAWCSWLNCSGTILSQAFWEVPLGLLGSAANQKGVNWMPRESLINCGSSNLHSKVTETKEGLGYRVLKRHSASGVHNMQGGL